MELPSRPTAATHRGMIKPFLRAESRLEHGRRNAVIDHMSADNPHMAISVWAARTQPLARGTDKLLACNDVFRMLCDGVLGKDFCTSFFSIHDPMGEHVKHSIRSSLAQASSVLDDLHLLRSSEASGQIVHVSKSGKLNYVYLHVIGIFNEEDGELREWVAAETPIELSADVPSDVVSCGSPQQAEFSPKEPPEDIKLLAAPAMIPSLAPSSPAPSPEPYTLPPPCKRCSSSYPDLVLTQESENQWVFTPSRVAALWVHTSKEEVVRRKRRASTDVGFCCTMCGATSTPQRRQGPAGPLTLCNRCGIRWAKQNARWKPYTASTSLHVIHL